MIELKHKQGNNWHITINGIDCMFTPIALYIGNNLYPEKANADNGLRWRINRKWVSYNKIKIAIKLNI